jgi:hypothetical protein
MNRIHETLQESPSTARELTKADEAFRRQIDDFMWKQEEKALGGCALDQLPFGFVHRASRPHEFKDTFSGKQNDFLSICSSSCAIRTINGSTKMHWLSRLSLVGVAEDSVGLDQRPFTG